MGVPFSELLCKRYCAVYRVLELPIPRQEGEHQTDQDVVVWVLFGVFFRREKDGLKILFYVYSRRKNRKEIRGTAFRAGSREERAEGNVHSEKRVTASHKSRSREGKK